jgi:hypothetical protein
MIIRNVADFDEDENLRIALQLREKEADHQESLFS